LRARLQTSTIPSIFVEALQTRAVGGSTDVWASDIAGALYRILGCNPWEDGIEKSEDADPSARFRMLWCPEWLTIARPSRDILWQFNVVMMDALLLRCNGSVPVALEGLIRAVGRSTHSERWSTQGQLEVIIDAMRRTALGSPLFANTEQKLLLFTGIILQLIDHNASKLSTFGTLFPIMTAFLASTAYFAFSQEETLSFTILLALARDLPTARPEIGWADVNHITDEGSISSSLEDTLTKTVGELAWSLPFEKCSLAIIVPFALLHDHPRAHHIMNRLLRDLASQQWMFPLPDMLRGLYSICLSSYLQCLHADGYTKMVANNNNSLSGQSLSGVGHLTLYTSNLRYPSASTKENIVSRGRDGYIR
jgi:hypothetical protein